MNDPSPDDRPDKIADIIKLYRLVRETPGLPMPHADAARASLDYRHVVHAEDAREAVSCAAGVLAFVFRVTFGETQATAGDGTPRYLLEALLPSGLTLVIISRVTQAGEGAPAFLAGAAEREMAQVA